MKKLYSQAPPCFCLCGESLVPRLLCVGTRLVWGEPRSQALVCGNKAGVGKASFPGSCVWEQGWCGEGLVPRLLCVGTRLV